MLKKLLAIVAMMCAMAAFAAVDVNKATAAELDGIKGIGPAISSKILDARKKGDFKDWNDFIERVKGVGEGNAAKLSAEGLTVGGSAFKPTAAAKDAKQDPKAAAKMTADEAKAKKMADKKAKDEEKKKMAEDAKAKTMADKKAADDAKMAKGAPKADAAKPAASAPKKS